MILVKEERPLQFFSLTGLVLALLGMLLAGCAATSATHATATKVPPPPRQTTQPGCPILGEVIDDRSSATGFIRSYYNALDRHDYTRAYSYYIPLASGEVTPTPAPAGDPLAPPAFATWKAGYATTACAIITYTGPEMPVTDATPGYHGIHHGVAVPVALTAVNVDGTIQQYTGMYAISADPAVGIMQSGAIAPGFSSLAAQ